MEARLADAEQLSAPSWSSAPRSASPTRSCSTRPALREPVLRRRATTRSSRCSKAALADTPDALPFQLAFAISCAAWAAEDEARTILPEGAAAGIAQPPARLPLDDDRDRLCRARHRPGRHAAVAAELYPIIEPFGASGGLQRRHQPGLHRRLPRQAGVAARPARPGRRPPPAGARGQRLLRLDATTRPPPSSPWPFRNAVARAGSTRKGEAWLDEAEAIAADRGLANVVDRGRAAPSLTTAGDVPV